MDPVCAVCVRERAASMDPVLDVRVRGPPSWTQSADVCIRGPIMDPVFDVRVREPIMDPALDVACERAYHGPSP